MPPESSVWEELTWSWAYSTGHPASDQAVEAAAKAAWPYALLCAWTYLHDRSAAHDLMDQAARNAADYAVRHRDVDTPKLTARVRSMLRRRAKQLAARQSREVSSGSLFDLDRIYAHEPDMEQRAIFNEMFVRLSPFAQSVLRGRQLGYTWREIAGRMDLDHTVIRRAYFRELEMLLRSLSRSGDSSQ